MRKYFISVFIVPGLLLFSAGPLAANGNPYVPGQMVLKLWAGQEDQLDSITNLYQATIVDSLAGVGCYLLQAPEGQDPESLSLEMEYETEVEYCDANYILAAPEPVQSSQPFIDLQARGDFLTQPASTRLSLPTAQAINSGTGVSVGVIDVGVNLVHPALAGNVVSGFDFVSNDAVATDEPGGSASGHGTFIAGVIKLVAPSAEIKAYRVLDTTGNGDGFSIAEAVVRAVDEGCKVINLSMVMSGKHGSLDQALTYARDHNVMVVAAAGNDSTEVQRYPASDSYVLSVAALDSFDLKAGFSNYGSDISLAAPGTMVYAPFLDTLYAWWNGTSFAAPFVAGTAALVYASNPSATWEMVRDALRNTATSVDSINPLYEGKLGTGMVNPLAAVQSVTSSVCGDLDQNQIGPDLADLTFLVDFLFFNGPACTNQMIARIDPGTGSPDISDLQYLIDYLFFAGSVPVCAP
ncbi:MAG: S8 family serine peptidase [Candidatus Zixiibacteriota bacterium]